MTLAFFFIIAQTSSRQDMCPATSLNKIRQYNMSNAYARPLLDHESIEGFMGNCLGIHKSLTSNGTAYLSADIAKKVRDAESAVGQTNKDCTVSSLRNRVREFRDDQAREGLRERILTELIDLDRLDSDDDIKLGKGGAKPKSRAPEPGAKAFFVIGLPASGKSTLVNSISDHLGAVILDSDFAKRKLPEFDGSPAGANLVHKESSHLVFGSSGKEPSLFGYCKENRFNIVIPKIGHDNEDLRSMRDGMIAAGYHVHLTATVLTREAAATRALARFLETGRYVPLGLIFDGYANDPIMNYYRERVEAEVSKSNAWASFGAISTSSAPATIVDCSSDENPVALLRKKVIK